MKRIKNDLEDDLSIITTLKFAWLPKKCAYTKQKIWLKFAYVIETRYVTEHPGVLNDRMVMDQIIFKEKYWVEKHTFLIRKLQGKQF